MITEEEKEKMFGVVGDFLHLYPVHFEDGTLKFMLSFSVSQDEVIGSVPVTMDVLQAMIRTMQAYLKSLREQQIQQ